MGPETVRDRELRLMADEPESKHISRREFRDRHPEVNDYFASGFFLLK